MSFKSKVPKLLGNLIAVVGFFNVFANIFRPFRGATRHIDSYTLVYVNSTAFSTSLISGLLLILISTGLKRRKKRAWTIAVLISAIGITAEAFRYHVHTEHILANLIALILLIIFRDEFYAKSDPGTKSHPIIGMGVGFLTFFTLGFLLLVFRHSSAIVGNPSTKEIALTVIRGFLGLSGPVVFHGDRVNDTVFTTLLIFGIAIFCTPIWLYFGKVKPKNQISIEDASKIKDIILKNSQSDSLSYFSTRLDKSVIWSDSHTAGVSYRVQNGVLLISGDPFGHFSLWSEVIDKSIALAKEYAWTLAVMGCGERAGELWIEKTKMTALHIGDEAIILVKEFTLEGSQMKNVREMINKTKRLGYEVEAKRVTELSEDEKALLKAKSIEWRYGQKERGFSMALDRFMNSIDDQEIYVLARKEGELLAFMTFSPWAKNGASLDRMLRSKDADTGVNELIITGAIDYARTKKIDRISLNFAAFRSIFEEAERISAGPILRLKRNILRFASKWVQVETLYRFNSKFQPEWNPRYLIYPGPSKLIEIGIAVGKAEGLF
jgi:lysyl-tRNA synthetase class 2